MFVQTLGAHLSFQIGPFKKMVALIILRNVLLPSSIVSHTDQRREKSLGLLTQNFVKLFVCSNVSQIKVLFFKFPFAIFFQFVAYE